jgi:hypothetical protein
MNIARNGHSALAILISTATSSDRWDWSRFALTTNTAYAEGMPVLSR